MKNKTKLDYTCEMLKPPNKGGTEGQTQPKLVLGNLQITRLSTATQAAAKGKPLSQQSIMKETNSKEQSKEEKAADMNDVAVPVPAVAPGTYRIAITKVTLLQPIVEALNKILDGDDSTERIIDGMFKYIKDSEWEERKSREAKERKEVQDEVSSLCKGFRADLVKFGENLSVRLNGITSVMNVTLEATEKAAKVTKEIKGSMVDIISKLGKVTNVADKIADTMQSYHNVLTARQTPTHKVNADPKVLGDMDRRVKQLLVDIYGDEGNTTLEKSLMELISKANKVLDRMSDADKPEKVKVEAALKTKKNAVLLMLNSKEAAEWIREVGNEETFADAFSKGAHIRDWEYILVVPRVPLTFKPENQLHLREIKEANSLPTHIICKARWIKLVAHRWTDQTHAHAILTIALVNTANKLIKDGLGICGSQIRPTKQKQEPIQCMKCR